MGVVVYTPGLLAAEVCRLCSESLAVDATPSHALWYASKDSVELHCSHV